MYETFKEDIEDACREHGNKKKRWTKEKRQDHDAYVEVRTR